jgi:hypothetical protein
MNCRDCERCEVPAKHAVECPAWGRRLTAIFGILSACTALHAIPWDSPEVLSSTPCNASYSLTDAGIKPKKSRIGFFKNLTIRKKNRDKIGSERNRFIYRDGSW